MHKLDEYKDQYIFLYTVDEKKLLCKPLSIDEEDQNNYIVDIIKPDAGYERGQHRISQDKVGYVVELPIEVQQGIELTLKFTSNNEDIQQDLTNEYLTSRVDFGEIKKQ
jgi:hypothetical protein